MAWTYSGDPSKSDLDKIRFVIGDTDLSDKLLNNEEINYIINTYGMTLAPYKVAESIAAKFSRFVDESVGAVKITYSQRVTHYNELAVRLKLDSVSAAMPYVGGTSKSDKKASEQNADRVKPKFTKDMLENKSDDRLDGK